MIAVPGQPAIADGAVVFDHGRVVAVGSWAEVKQTHGAQAEDLGDVVVAPGVINAHTHLELSHLDGLVGPGGGFAAWVGRMLQYPRNNVTDEALARAMSQLQACGTVHVMDHINHHVPRVAAALGQAGIGGLLGVEYFGFGLGVDLTPPDSHEVAEGVAMTAAGHALYSTAPETLQATKQWCRDQGKLFFLHLAEHPDETLQMQTGSGEFLGMLQGAGVVPQDWQAPGCSPVAYADALGLLDDRTLAVHCVHLSDEDVALLARRKVNVCLCPRSNEYIGVGQARWSALRDAGVNLCLGTDSLASNVDLDLWQEALAILAGTHGKISFSEVLQWMTVNPARALGLENSYGTLEPGKVQGYSIVPKDVIAFT